MKSEKTKQFIKKIKYPLLSFLIPILVMIFLFIVVGGLDAEQLSIGDMQAQHADMLLYFKKILTGQESIFYSITKGLGGDMYSTMAYYMLSPINLITLLFEDAKIILAVRLIIVIKVALSGLTMYLLLNSKQPNKKLYSLIFALCYALMAFVINNYFCTLWLDAVFLAPIVIMGIDKLINKKKVSLYMISLALCIFTNFYFGYMVCIFSVIYFVYSLLLKYKKQDKKEIIETIIRFLVASLLAGLSVAIIYIPSIISVLKSDRVTITANEATLLNTIYRLFAGSYQMSDFLSYFHPCLYCGLLTIILFITFLFNKKVKEKEKVITGSIVLIFIFSILFYQLSYLWHGFSYPIGYNFRFSFLFCLFILIIAHKQLCIIQKPTKALKYTLSAIILLSLVFVFKRFSVLAGYISVIFLIIYSLIIFSKREKMKYVLFFLVLIELVFNSYKTFFVNNDHFTSRESLETDICQNLPDSTGYRVAGYDYYGVNENIACGVSGTRLFVTTINSNITNFYSNVGFAGGINMYNDNIKDTPIIYSLLGTKYFYSNQVMKNYNEIKQFKVNKDNDYRKEYYEEINYIYENPYALSLGYMVKVSQEYGKAEAGLAYQNEIIKNFSGIDKDVLIPIEKENDDKIIDSKYLYFYFNSEVDYLNINDEVYNDIPSNEVIAIENKYNTTKFEIEAYNKDGSPADYRAYYLDFAQFLNAINQLQNNQLENIAINKNVITGDIDVKEDGVLAISIPYEKGFKLYVDGKEKQIKTLYDFFISVDLEAGYHTIKLVYVPNTLKASLCVSVIAIGLALAFVVNNDKLKIRKKGE